MYKQVQYVKTIPSFPELLRDFLQLFWNQDLFNSALCFYSPVV